MNENDKSPSNIENFEEAIEKYLEEKMNPAEEAGFKSLLNNNPELKEHFELEKDLRLIGDMEKNPEKYQENKDLLEAIKIMDAKARNTQKAKSFKKWIIGTGVIAILATLGIYLANSISDSQSTIPDLPITELFHPYPIYADAPKNSALEAGLDAYKNGELEEARINLNQSLSGRSTKGIIQFLLATIDIYESNPEKGLDRLAVIESLPETEPIGDAVKYYQGLAFLLLGDKENGLDYLKNLEKSEDDFVRKKTALIKDRLKQIQ